MKWIFLFNFLIHQVWTCFVTKQYLSVFWKSVATFLERRSGRETNLREQCVIFWTQSSPSIYLNLPKLQREWKPKERQKRWWRKESALNRAVFKTAPFESCVWIFFLSHRRVFADERVSGVKAEAGKHETPDSLKSHRWVARFMACRPSAGSQLPPVCPRR